MPLRTNAVQIPLLSSVVTANLSAGSGQLVPPLPQVFQRAEEWCWAACCQMVLNRLQVNIEQCGIVNKVFDQAICCDTPDVEACNQPVDPSQIAAVYEKCGHQAQLLTNPISFESLQAEILNGARPVEVGVAWAGGGGHVAMVWGAKTDPQGPLLLVNDPKYGSGAVYYANLLRAYGLGTWQWTWISIS